MRARVLVVLGLALSILAMSSGTALASGGIVTSQMCGLDSCHSHPGFVGFNAWHDSHRYAQLNIPCESCHPNNHTQSGPPSAPDAMYSLREACNPCHVAATTTAPAHAAAGITSCVVCHQAVGALSGTVTGPSGQLADVSITVAGMPTVLSYSDGSYFVAGVAPGTYSVTYEKAGYTTRIISGVDIVNGATSKQNVLLSAVPVVIPVVEDTAIALTSTSRSALPYGSAFVVSGVVSTNSDGLGVSSAPVVLEWSVDGVTFSSSGPTTQTAGNGAFLFTVRPTTRTYYRVRFADDDTHSGSVSTAVYATTKAYLTNPVAPAGMSRLRYYTVYGYLKPRHTPGSYPVRIYRWRYVGGKWTSYGFVSAVASNYSGFTKYSRSVKLPYAGRWRLRAYHADSGHVATWSSGYDYVTVK